MRFPFHAVAGGSPQSPHKNLTYAEYAREGFAQLLVAALLVIAVVAGAWRWARVGGAPQARTLRLLLALLCLLSLVVVASALHRLDLPLR